MAGFPLCTGGTGGHINAPLLQKVQHSFGFYAAAGEIENIGQPVLRTLNHGVGNGGNLFPAIVPQDPDFLFFLCQGRQRLYRRAESAPGRHGFRAGAHGFFLSAANGACGNMHALSDIQSARSLGSVDFMGADRHQVHPDFPRLQCQLSERLHRVHMKQRPGLVPANDSRRRLDGQNAAHLVVDSHHAHQRGVRRNDLFHLPGRNPAKGIGL